MRYSDDDDRAWRERTLPWTSIDAYQREQDRGADVAHAAHVIRAFHKRNNEPMGTMEVAIALGAKENEHRVVCGGPLNEDEVQRAMTALRRKKVLEWHGVAYKNNRGYWCKRSRIRLAEKETFELALEEPDPPPAPPAIKPTLVVDNDRPERARPDPNQLARDREVERIGWDAARMKWIRAGKARVDQLETSLRRLNSRALRLDIDGAPFNRLCREERGLVVEVAELTRLLLTWNSEIGKGPVF